MVRGVFVDNIPVFQTTVAWGQSVQTPYVVLDTGFTGDLQVTPKMAQELGLSVSGVTKATIANGQTVDVPVALAMAGMEGKTSLINVLISASMPLAGISFLSKFNYQVTIDCKHRTVSLEQVT